MAQTVSARMAFDRPIFVIVLVLVVVAAILLAVGLDVLRAPSLQVNIPTAAANLPASADTVEARLRDAEQKYEQIRIKLEYAEKQSDRIQRMLAALVSVASIFAAALGLTAYYNLKQTVENGKEELARLREFRETMQAQFPAIGDMDTALISILSSSLAVLRVRTEEWRERLYPNISEDETVKQKIALAEIQAGAFGFFSLKKVASYSAQASEIYYRLGRFYGSKYCSARKNKCDQVGDLYRSILYFETALRYDDEGGPRRAEIRSDLGFMRLEEHHREPDPEKRKSRRAVAEQCFRDSLADRSDQASALLALAWIERRDYSVQQAEQTLTRLIREVDEADLDSLRFLHKGYYNRGCYRAVLAREKNPHAPELQPVIDDLEKARELLRRIDGYWTQWIEGLNTDSTGDLAILQEVQPEVMIQLREPLSNRQGVADHKEPPLKTILAQLRKKLSTELWQKFSSHPKNPAG